MEEKTMVTVTEMYPDGGVSVESVPSEQYNEADYIPSEESKTGVGTVFVGAAAVIGVGAAAYGVYKGIKKLRKIITAGIKAVREEENNECIDDSDGDYCEVVEDPEVSDFVEEVRGKKENGGK